ncbi:MAG TPA: hypothetical protein VM368_00090 [Flavisolibacter sp.]|nr:hypothetical protein [Flavisolibacter sp.]
MRWSVLIWIGFALYACTGNDNSIASKEYNTKTEITSTSEYNAAAEIEDSIKIISNAPKPIKAPKGIYQFSLPISNGQHIQHIISFSGNNYTLQQEYRQDSAVITNGTWAVSNGFIWLYHKQVVNGRYRWKGDLLHYYNPINKKDYPLQEAHSALAGNAVLQQKGAEGFKLYGVGTEPFWSIELTKLDTLIFNNTDLSQSVKVKLTSTTTKSDTTIYVGNTDNIKMSVAVLPYFCSDGMSDFIYQTQIEVRLEGKKYRGCGIKYL